MLSIAQRIEETLRQFLAELPHTRGRVTLHYDDDGSARLSGATDTRGYVTKQDRMLGNTLIPAGTKIRGHCVDSLRVAYGYTTQDLSDLRKRLAKDGITLSLQDVEAMLLEGRATLKHGNLDSMDPEARRLSNRKAIAKRREWARENGYCTICTTNAVSYREDGTPYATCTDCQKRANEARRRRREEARKPKRKAKKK